MGRSPCCSKELLNRGAWTSQEDKLLRDYISVHGEGKWSKLPQRAGLKRCGKSCRLRWLNYLRPNIKRGNISKEEEDLIIRLHNLLGNRWSLIAGRIPGRTDNEIKNYWNTTLGKRVRGRGNGTSTTSTEENINMQKTKSQSTLITATPSLSLSPPKLDSYHSNVLFRTKASKCSKSLFIDPIFPHSPIMQLQRESNKAPEHEEGHAEPSSLLVGDDDDDAANNNISATSNNEIETVVYDNEILSFPSEEDKELSMDLLFDYDVWDVCFSDLLNLDSWDARDLGNNNSNSSEDFLPQWDKPLASSLEIDPRSDFCDETNVAK